MPGLNRANIKNVDLTQIVTNVSPAKFREVLVVMNKSII